MELGRSRSEIDAEGGTPKGQPLLRPHEAISSLAAAAFFIVGLLAGAWKWAHIRWSSHARAPVYVDVTHRSSLLYAFACLLIARLAALGALPEPVKVMAVASLIAFFVLTVAGYAVHGLLQDTDNQLARPHRLGRATIPTPMMDAFMISLIAAEIGAFAVLAFGFARTVIH